MSKSVSYSLLDKIIMAADESLRTLFGHVPSARENPANNIPSTILSPTEKKQSGAVMRVNHVGEVCAQALYTGQSLATRSPIIQDVLKQAAREENDHLVWCEERLKELNTHASYLNPVWYLGSLLIGIAAGYMGDKWSLGFVVETEQQVEQHLHKSINQLPRSDGKSRAILEQMCDDEIQHATLAKNTGAADLPSFVKTWMALSAKLMTTTAYWI